MLRLICYFTVIPFVLLTAAKVPAQQPTSSSVLAREGVSIAFMGGCSDTRLDGVWLAVRAESAEAPPTASLEMWFADASAKGGAALRLMHVLPAASVRAAGCIVLDATKLTWTLSEEQLRIYSMSRDGLAVLGTADFSAGEILSVGVSGGSLVFVAVGGVAVVSLDSGKTIMHSRDSFAAAYESRTRHLFSVQAVDGEGDKHGFPAVALVKERISGDGRLHEVARTDPWPMFESIGERQGIPLEANDVEFVGYCLVANNAKVILLRNYVFGTRRLALRTFDAGTLKVVRDVATDVEDVAHVFGLLDAVAVGDDVLIGIPRDIGGVARAGLLRIPAGHGVAEYLVPTQPLGLPPAATGQITPFALGRSIYAVSNRSTRQDNSWLDQVSVDIFNSTP